MINSYEDMERTVQKLGFLPFFKNNIEGFSIEEMTPGNLWFSNEEDGPWEWKGPVIREGNCAYGKLFGGKAGYVSLDLYSDFLNMRRADYWMSDKEKEIYRILVEHESLLSKELKRLGGYVRKTTSKESNNPLDHLIKRPSVHKKGYESFETIMTRLQMHCYVVIADFEYQYTHDGKRYGWGIARYTTPEALFDKDITNNHGRSPIESRDLLIKEITGRLPQISENQIIKLIDA